jgi:hypothetical protein
MLSIGLLIVAMASNMLYREGYRVLICSVVILVAMAHVAFFYDAVSFSYYGTVAIANLIIIQAVSFCSKSPLATDIQIINCIGMLVQLFGYIQYEGGYSPSGYNSLMVMLITAEFIRLIMRTDRDRIFSICKADRLHSSVFTHGNSCNTTNTGRFK